LYNENLTRIEEIVTPRDIEGVKSVYHLYVVRVGKEIRESLQEHLNSNGIQTGIHYPISLPELKAYRYMENEQTDFSEAKRASKEILSLPIFPELEEKHVRYVSEKIVKFFAERT
jgi:dTDP-4-amino-4,6-dideoxygalactose transaminase